MIKEYGGVDNTLNISFYIQAPLWPLSAFLKETADSERIL